MEKTLTQEVSHEGNKFFLPSKDTIKEEECPLDRGGVIEDKGRGFFRDIVVARRFKKRGMSWLRQYPNPLLKIKLGSKLYIGETQAFLINYSGNLFLNYLSHFFLPLSALCKIFSIDYGISSPFILPFFTISSANFSAFSLVIVINLRPIKISLLK